MHHFFAYVSRMKYIRRWGLMRNTQSENNMEHSFQAALIAHGLAVIGNTYFDKNNNCEEILTLALFHDASEVITGDLPTPVKYQNTFIQKEYKQIETSAFEKLNALLPAAMQSSYTAFLAVGSENALPYQYVKAADKLCAYIKCIEEEKAGNCEFIQAKKTIFAWLTACPLPEVKFFIQEFLPSFSMSIDELSQG